MRTFRHRAVGNVLRAAAKNRAVGEIEPEILGEAAVWLLASPAGIWNSFVNVELDEIRRIRQLFALRSVPIADARRQLILLRCARVPQHRLNDVKKMAVERLLVYRVIRLELRRDNDRVRLVLVKAFRHDVKRFRLQIIAYLIAKTSAKKCRKPASSSPALPASCAIFVCEEKSGNRLNHNMREHDWCRDRQNAPNTRKCHLKSDACCKSNRTVFYLENRAYESNTCTRL